MTACCVPELCTWFTYRFQARSHRASVEGAMAAAGLPVMGPAWPPRQASWWAMCAWYSWEGGDGGGDGVRGSSVGEGL